MYLLYNLFMDIKPLETKLLHNWLGSGSINIFGRPFSGKDTQAKILADFFNCFVIGGGDLIRNSNATSVKRFIEEGKLAPQADYLKIVLPLLNQAKYQNKPLILSSLGRWHSEEKEILESTNKANHPIKAVIYLDISEQIVYERLQKAQQLKDRGHRKDDNHASIKTRLQEFKLKTIPVINVYQQKNLLIQINGNQSRMQVTKEIFQKLISVAKNKD